MAITDTTIEDQNGRIYYRSLITPLFTFFTDESDGIMMSYNNDVLRKPLQGYGAEN